MAQQLIPRNVVTLHNYRPVLNADDAQYRPLLRFRCRCSARRCAGLIRA